MGRVAAGRISGSWAGMAGKLIRTQRATNLACQHDPMNPFDLPAGIGMNDHQPVTGIGSPAVPGPATIGTGAAVDQSGELAGERA
jgi:hypothetical protein